MQNIYCFIKKLLILTALMAGIFLYSFWPGEAYAPEPTHVALVEATAKLFNQFNEDKLTPQEIEWLKKGVREEDAAPRWLNHFYDPTTGQGWNGKNIMEFGYELPAFLVKFGQGIIIGGKVRSSVDWVDNREAQAEYGSYLGDQTWSMAIQSLALGDRQSAFVAMGHVLHLVQDMTVPAHTRQDTHSDAGLGDADPYESWLKISKDHSEVKNFDEIAKDYPNWQCSDIKNCLKKLATYSNHYFFSKDTIENEYEYPKILFRKTELVDGTEYQFGYGKDENDKNTRLIIIKDGIPIIDKTAVINSDYYSRLSKQAIMGGAKVIELFKEQADRMSEEEAKSQPVVKAKNKVFSFLANYLKAKPKIDKFMDQLAEAGRLMLSYYKQKAERENYAAEKAVEMIYGLNSKKDFDLGVAIDEPPLPPDKAIAISPNVQVILPPSTIETINTITENYNEQPLFIHEPYEPSPPAPKASHLGGQAAPYLNEGEGEDQDKIENNTLTAPENPPLIPPFSKGDMVSDPGAALPASLSYEQPIISITEPSPRQNFSENLGGQAPSSPADITPPDITLGLKDYKLTSLTWIVFWQSSSTDVGYFEAQWKKINETNWSDWSYGSSTEQIFDAPEDNKIYQFRARVADTAGNISAWVSAEAEVATKPVVINEIAWMGTGSSSQLSKDEWIELYNKSNQDLSLENWTLTGGNGGPNIAFASTSIIGAKSYFLIERSDDETVSDISADSIANFGNGLNDDGESLILKNADGEVADELPDGEWFSGDKDNRRTMERISPYLSANLSNNWQTNDGITINGLAADGATKIYGTPRGANSIFNANYIIPSYTWSKAKILDEDWSPGSVGSPSLTFDNQNNPRLVYILGGGAGFRSILYKHYDNGSWSANREYAIAGQWNFSVLTAPHLAMDNFNRPTLVFTGGNPTEKSVYMASLENSAWTSRQNISGTSTQAYYSVMSIDKNGGLHIAWETIAPDYEIYYSTPSSDITKISSSSEIAESPVLATDQNNQSHLVWFEYARNGGVKGLGIYYSKLSGGVWSEPQKIFDYYGLETTHPDSPALVIDKNNVLHLAWSDMKNKSGKGDIYYSRYDGVNWIEPVNISQSTSTLSRLPSMTADKDGRAHIVWAESVNGKDQIWYSRSDENQIIWEAPKKIFSEVSRNFSHPNIIVDLNGRLHLSWNTYGPNPSTLFYAHTEP